MNITYECHNLHSLEVGSYSVSSLSKIFPVPSGEKKRQQDGSASNILPLSSIYLSVCLSVDYSSSTGDDASSLSHTICSTTIVSSSNKSIKHRNERKDGLKIIGLVLVRRHRWLEETLRRTAFDLCSDYSLSFSFQMTNDDISDMAASLADNVYTMIGAHVYVNRKVFKIVSTR